MHLSEEDNFIWYKNYLGKLMVKYTYLLLFKNDLTPQYQKNVWNGYLIPKINFFWWTSLDGNILAYDNLRKRGFHIPNRCYLCKIEEEDIYHISLFSHFLEKLDNGPLEILYIMGIFELRTIIYPKIGLLFPLPIDQITMENGPTPYLLGNLEGEK